MPGNRRCVYCLGMFPKKEMTSDHVIARSWFSSDTPKGTPMWKVPACFVCNNKKSKIENEILIHLCLGVGPDEAPALREMCAKTHRAWQPSKARNARDAERRFKTREKLLKSAIKINDLGEEKTLPFFRNENLAKGADTMMPLNREFLDTLIKMWICGIHYCVTNHYVPSDAQVSSNILEDKTANDILMPFMKHAKYMAKGSVEVIIFHASEDDKWMAMYGFSFWGKVKTYGFIDNSEGRADIGA